MVASTRFGLRSLTVALVVVAVLFGGLHTAFASTYSLVLNDDEIPGVAMPASPVAGALDADDWVDVYRVSIPAGKTLVLSLAGSASTDFGLSLYRFDARSLAWDLPILVSEDESYPRTISYSPPSLAVGTYYVAVEDWGAAAGTYSLSYSLSDAPVAMPDDNIPGVPLSANWNGDLNVGANDVHDVKFNPQKEGDNLTYTLNDSASLSASLRLYPPGSRDVWTDDWVAESVSLADGTQQLTYTVPAGAAGTYYLDVNADYGAGSYTLALSTVEHRAVRVSGTSRYETSYAVSRSAFPTSNWVVLATGRDYPDAMTASGLAGVLHAPILLVPPTGEIPMELIDELLRLRATSAYIVGGTSAISTDVEIDLLGMGLLTSVKRISGQDRYQTAGAVAAEMNRLMPFQAPMEVFVVNGRNFADALAVAPYAYKRQSAILLHDPLQSAPNPHTLNVIAWQEPPWVYVVGGTASVNDAAYLGLQNSGSYSTLSYCRIAGADRYETNRGVANFAVGRGWANWQYIAFASGTGFPDALSGGPATGQRGGVLLLTRPTVLPAGTNSLLDAHMGTTARVHVLGGSAAVADMVFNELDDRY